MKTQGGLARKARLAAVAAAVLLVAMPAKAMAEDQQVAGPPSGQLMEVVHVNTELVKALVDPDGDDSQLGDQPGDINEPDEIVPPDASGEDENFEAPGDPVEPPDAPPSDDTPPDVTHPSEPETRTPRPSTPETRTSSRKTLPFTGGNELFCWIAGGLVMTAGIGVLVLRRPRKH